MVTPSPSSPVKSLLTTFSGTRSWSPLYETFLRTHLLGLARRVHWSDRQALIGKTVKFKYQAIGTKDKPRIPVFLGWRDARDMS